MSTQRILSLLSLLAVTAILLALAANGYRFMESPVRWVALVLATMGFIDGVLAKQPAGRRLQVCLALALAATTWTLHRWELQHPSSASEPMGWRQWSHLLALDLQFLRSLAWLRGLADQPPWVMLVLLPATVIALANQWAETVVPPIVRSFSGWTALLWLLVITLWVGSAVLHMDRAPPTWCFVLGLCLLPFLWSERGQGGSTVFGILWWLCLAALLSKGVVWLGYGEQVPQILFALAWAVSLVPGVFWVVYLNKSIARKMQEKEAEAARKKFDLQQHLDSAYAQEAADKYTRE